LLFVLGAGIQTAALVLDAAAIGLGRGPAQLVRNILGASLKVLFLGGYILLAARTSAGLLAGWDISSLLSFLIVPTMLGLGKASRRGFRLGERVQLVRRLWVLSLRHHVLNLAIGSVAYILPIIAGLFILPADMAYYTMAQLIASGGVLVPYLLATSLFVESTGDERLLRRSMRRTLPLSLAGCVIVVAALEPTAGLVLAVFGRAYATHGALILRIVLPGAFGYTLKDHFVAARRSQERLEEAAKIGALATIGELVAAALGGWLGGIDWLCGAWVMATVVELMAFSPSVIAVIRKPRAATEEPDVRAPKGGRTPAGTAAPVSMAANGQPSQSTRPEERPSVSTP